MFTPKKWENKPFFVDKWKKQEYKIGNTNIGTTAAHLPDADKTFANVKDKFIDTIKGGCVVVYTGIKG